MRMIKRVFACSLALAVAVTSCLPGFAMPEAEAAGPRWSDSIAAMTENHEYIEGEAIACIRTNGKKAAMRTAAVSGSSTASVQELMSLSGDSPESGGTGLRKSAGGGAGEESLVVVRDPGKSTREILEGLAEDDSVLYAEPNYLYSSEALKEETVYSEAEAKDSASSANEKAGDGTSLQYAYSPEGTHRSEARTGMNLPNWNSEEGNMDHDVIVAVLDTGVDWTHPDLRDQVVRLSEAQQRALGCGERGYDACPKEAGNAMDDPEFAHQLNEHGTHCAGIIGAAWDGKGISGAASRAEILPVKINSSVEENSSCTETFLRALSFVKRGYQLESDPVKTRILSISWAMNESGRAINTALEDLGKSCGIITFLAAGNDGINLCDAADMADSIQTNPYVVVVGATDQSDNLASFSNCSAAGVDIAAPGDQILSTVPQNSLDYIPSLAPVGSNAAFWGAEQSEDIRFTMTDDSGKTIGTSAQTDARSASGKRCYQIMPDRKIREGEKVTILSNPIDLRAKITSQDTCYLGFGIDADGYFNYKDELYKEDNIQIKTKNGWKALKALYLAGDRWTMIGEALPEDTDFGSFQMKISLTANDDYESGFWLDEIGIGTERTSYIWLSGTSMATPAAAGAAAVLAAGYDSFPDYDVAQLRADVIGSSHSVEALEGYINNGGVFDLGVSRDEYGPSIAALTAKTAGTGTDLTLSGYYFGSEKGSVSARMISGGKKSDVPISSVKSWTDRKAVLHTNKNLASVGGVLEVTLTSANGKHYTKKTAVKKSTAVFEKELVKPSLPDEIYEMDAFEDFETTGTMLGLDNSLIYLQDCFNDEKSLYTHKIWSYDLAQTGSKSRWTGQDMKEPLMRVSAVAYNGKILLEGTSMDNMAYGVPFISQFARERIYLYDPKDHSWTLQCSDGVSVYASIVNVNGKLYTIDYDAEAKISKVFSYSPKTGAGSPVCTLKQPVGNPKTAVCGGKIYILYAQENLISFQVVSGAKCTDYTEKLPEYVWRYTGTFDTAFRKFSLTAISQGVILAGPGDLKDRTTTWLFDTGTAVFSPYKKQVADDNVLGATVCGYDGALWAMISEVYDTKGEKMAFRSTAADTPSYSIRSAKFSCSAASYTGKKITPKNAKVTLKKANGKTVDITKYVNISYSNNVNPGKAKVLIKAKSGQLLYQGSTTGSFTINRAPSTVTLSFSAKSAKRGKSILIKTANKNGQKIRYSVPKTAKGITVSSAGKLTVAKNAKRGTYKITLKADQTKYYKAKTMTVTVDVKKKIYTVRK